MLFSMHYKMLNHIGHMHVKAYGTKIVFTCVNKLIYLIKYGTPAKVSAFCQPDGRPWTKIIMLSIMKAPKSNNLININCLSHLLTQSSLSSFPFYVLFTTSSMKCGWKLNWASPEVGRGLDGYLPQLERGLTWMGS